MNIELARKTAAEIRLDNGKNWNQRSWWIGGSLAEAVEMPVSELLEHKCGTTGCAAGWAVALAHPGAVFTGTEYVKLKPNALTESISVIAREDLDLTYDQSDWLFSSYRTHEQVLWALENDDPAWHPGSAPLTDPDGW